MTWQPIVAGVDGSPASFQAASFAWRLARAADARCVLVHALLVGSTTERLLNRLPTSLLVVPIAKPAARRVAPEQRVARPKPPRKGTLIL